MSHKNNIWLHKQLKSWQDDGIIDGNQALKLQIMYPKPSTSSFDVNFILYIVASLFIGTGVILLISFNWYSIPKMVKLTVTFLLLAALQLPLIYAYIKGKTKLKEILIVFTNIVFLGNIALVGQIYHLGGTLEDLLFAWLIPAILLAYALKSHIFYLIASFATLFLAEGSSYIYYLVSSILLLGWLYYYFNYYKYGKFALQVLFGYVVIYLLLIVFIDDKLYFGSYMDDVVYILLSGLSVILFHLPFRVGKVENSLIFFNMKLAKIFFMLNFIFLIFIYNIELFSNEGDVIRLQDVFTHSEVYYLIMFLVVFILIHLYALYLFIKVKAYQEAVFICVALFVTIFSQVFYIPSSYYFLAIILSLSYIFAGVMELNKASCTAGVFWLMLVGIIYVLSSNMDLLFRSIVMMLTGVFFIIINSILRKYIKKLEEKEICIE